MSKRADKIVAELEQMSWKDVYDHETVRLSKAITDPRDPKGRLNIHRWVLRHLKGGEKVLDVGCGVGVLCSMLEEAGMKPTGVDVSPYSIEVCQKSLPGIEFKEAYGEKLPFEDNTFDAVASTEVIEHLKDPKQAVSEMLRVVKPGGKLLITTPIEHNFDGGGRSKHVNFWDYYQMMHFFEEFGEDFKIFYLNKFIRFNQDGEPSEKNIFGIKFVKGERNE